MRFAPPLAPTCWSLAACIPRGPGVVCFACSSWWRAAAPCTRCSPQA